MTGTVGYYLNQLNSSKGDTNMNKKEKDRKKVIAQLAEELTFETCGRFELLNRQFLKSIFEKQLKHGDNK